MITYHFLKIHPQPFEELKSGAKTCEVRNCSDRDFKVGDYVSLSVFTEDGIEVRPSKGATLQISHIQRGYGLPDDLCVLSYGKVPLSNLPLACGPGRDPQKLTAEEELSWLRNPDRMGQ